uniref:Uncharacterized protein n=1 Tax=Acrobeloides nanus TaxID=290746 RepID=A0A914DE33_9BILA
MLDRYNEVDISVYSSSTDENRSEEAHYYGSEEIELINNREVEVLYAERHQFLNQATYTHQHQPYPPPLLQDPFLYLKFLYDNNLNI